MFAPVYSGREAALHSYTMTLGNALHGTSLLVVELIPPAVQTGLSGSGAPHGASLDEFCDSVFSALAAEGDTIGFGPTDTPEFRELIGAVERLFKQRSANFHVETYASTDK